VVLVGRDAQRLGPAAEAAGAEWAVADVSQPAAVARLCEDVRSRFEGEPDILVNSAGAFELAPIAQTSIESFDRLIAVNLRAVFLLVRQVLPGMLGRGSGDIVSIGSIAGRQGFADNGAYSASKFGLRGLHAVLATESRGTGVRATLIEPSATDTELWDTIDRERFSGLPERASMLGAEAVAQAVLYAVSQGSTVAVPNLILEHS
jgi:NADP-dependent 3-hydroxy acid dehydrogenase YdfG